jgi:predicted O-methyltransferase YrrM
MPYLTELIGRSLAYVTYFIRASHRGGHGLHSPLVYDFITSVLADRTRYEAYKTAENHRERLLNNKTLIELTDFGAGSQVNGFGKRSVGAIAKHAPVNTRFGRLLYRIARYYKPDLIIELGTSLGISTHYLAFGNPDAKIITIEGDPCLASLATECFAAHRLTHVSVINDTFDHALPSILPEIPEKALVFIDGNHGKTATLKYADYFLSRVPRGSILVFDDINWSAGMRQAWKKIQNNKKNYVTVDLLYFGIVFQEDHFFKEKYIIRF